MEIRRITRTHSLVRRVAECVRCNHLIRPGDRILVAVSGGPDSVCLLAALAELRDCQRIPGLQIHIGHLNYGLRGEDSERDEAFVRELAARFGVPISCERVRLTSRPGGSLQRQARDIRYAYFARVLRENGLTSVATGHTADDQAETILMWLLRGSGTAGLTGIPVMREGGIIRPLLRVSRSEVLDYLGSRGIAYRMDASNVTGIYRRNRIRHDVLPLLRSFNPRIVEGLARVADILAAEAAFLDDVERERWRGVLITASTGRIVLSCERLVGQPVGLQRRLVRRALVLVRGRAEGLTFRHVAQVLDGILEGREGTGLDLPGGIRVGRHGDHLTVESGATGSSAGSDPEWASGVAFPIPGEVWIGEGSRRVCAVHGRRTGGRVGPDRSQAIVDADRLGGPLTVRAWRAGDWFAPSGMQGRRKKLQDFFVDEKVPRALRGRVPLVVSPAGIVWVVGYRADERFKVGTETIRPVTLYLTEEA